jgi:hypothetical protein
VQVEVVGGLVQQQQVRLHKQRPRQAHTHAPAATEGARGAQHIGGLKGQPSQDGRGTRLGAVSVYLYQPFPHLRQQQQRERQAHADSNHRGQQVYLIFRYLTLAVYVISSIPWQHAIHSACRHAS